MIEHDSLQRFVFAGAPVRGEVVHLDASWRAVLERHAYPPPVRQLLGELMVSAVLLSATLKYEGKLVMQIQGDGPITLLVAECTSGRTVRGLAHWAGEVAPSAALVQATGHGKLVITLDPLKGRQRYQSIVPLEGTTIAQALEGYLARSEQIDTRLWVASDAVTAAGMLVQRLPGPIEDEDVWERVVQLGATVEPTELLRLPFEELLYRLYHEEDVTLFEAEPVSFRCTCSRERVQDMLRTLGPKEVQDILAQEGRVGVHCQFCNRYYDFDRVDAELLFSTAGPELPPTRH